MSRMHATPPESTPAAVRHNDREHVGSAYVPSRATAVRTFFILLLAGAVGYGTQVSLDRAIGVLAFVIGLVALYYAIHTDKGAERIRADTHTTLAALQVAVKQLDGVRTSLTTRGVGTFPDYVPLIAQIVASAERSVEVLCDFPAYAAVTSHAKWREYHLALCRCHDRSRVPERDFALTVVCLAASTRRELVEKQFPADAWPRSIQDENVARRLEYFMRQHSPGYQGGTIARDDFLAASEALNEAAEQELDAHVITGLLPLYCWVIDGSTAIFAVASLRGPKTTGDAALVPNEVAFRTDDPVLIDGLTKIVRGYAASAPPPLS